MNCQRGDLAVLVEDLWLEDIFTGERRVFQDSGLVMTCETLLEDGCWVLDNPRNFVVKFKGPITVCIAGVLTAIRDDALRPLRKHGDDEVDQVVERLGPAPMTLTELLRGEETAHG